MTITKAQRIGRNKTFKSTLVVLVILLLLLLIEECKGDFANGLLFFINGLVNIHALFILTILFGLTYLFGGKAGKEIIIQRKNVLIVMLKYVPLISLAICFYAIALSLIRQESIDFADWKIQLTSNYIPLFMKTAFSLFLAWFWATNRIKANLVPKTE